MDKITFIAPYQELGLLVERVIKDFQENIEVKIGRMGKGVRLAKEAEENGSGVIISRGITTWKIKETNIKIPVIDLPITGYDLLRTYYEAKESGNKVGMVDIPEVIQGIESIEEIIGCKVCKIYSYNIEDIEEGINQLYKQGVDIVIGKIIMIKLANKHGMKGVNIKSGRQAILQAIREATSVLKATKQERERVKQEKKRVKQMKAILEFAHEGMIVTDKLGVIKLFNPIAEEITKIDAQEAIGKKINSINYKFKVDRVIEQRRAETNQIKKIANKNVIVTKVPIIVEGEVVRVAVNFQDISKVQKIEHKIRREFLNKGHVAKYSFKDIIGKNQNFLNTIEQAKKFAKVDSTILIHGETGVGKEYFGQAIHKESLNKKGPFIAVNCAALPKSLLESELFGYEEGAFTGAKKGGKPGLFELAHGGTILLDEISEMAKSLQARLLRVLQEREVMRLGDDKIIPIDIRVIATTNRDLFKMIEEDQFREDLFYRINVLNLRIPALRERKDDIPLFVSKFKQQFCRRFNKSIPKITPEIMKILQNYHWPGNIRQLKNVIERIVILTTEGESISIEVINQALQDFSFEDYSIEPSKELDPTFDNLAKIATEYSLEKLEAYVIRNVLKEVDGNRSEAARKLGIARSTLWRKLKQGE
ncbi:sigma 54-interacting transcriptional regulator [Selenihalanaerobacter shriftii]|uniref:PAS domain S-box-containing protein n=1 Tax=Selenihalanaerobacter shriftii TaxID=142842 RepID=A0A1T4JJL9_9FIRM|nr:sigma 54-interacting transcriptional regulator [Selenihalanaerobacter shriftii]SJZ30341.1 PAS domain S-box-containing protein [Selenihalanaerobacter shriftii]